jgi:hypothetical protein
MSEENRKLFLVRFGSTKHIDAALKNGDNEVKENAMENPFATVDHITTALKDPDRGVKAAAKERLSANNQ